MNKRRIVYEPRSKRARRSLLLKAGVWIFLLLFVFSVAGGVVLISAFGR
ncbi:MAG: hypothetical protein M3R51_06520 [Candidatus Eremiobacteraeota bacterium]|nr:hypothetical protein [Candidatus Eremiobacteraeota bacterium]